MPRARARDNSPLSPDAMPPKSSEPAQKRTRRGAPPSAAGSFAPSAGDGASCHEEPSPVFAAACGETLARAEAERGLLVSGTASVKVEGDALAASAKDAFAGSQGGSLSVNLTTQEVLARAETPISVQSVAGGQALARAEAGPAFVALTAADVLNKFTRGVRRIPLDELGVSPVNRRINGPYVHQLGRRILSVEGFTRLRYRNGLCHEPSPDDPLAVARFTNAAAQGSGLLSPVPVKALFGSFGKSHLLSFLQALKSGQVYWNETQDLMLPVAAQQELMEHLQHGMFYEVLAWEAVRDHGPALQALMAADNFDAGFALGQTELQLLRGMREAIVVCRPPVGLTVFDVCLQEVERTLGARWRQEELVCFFFQLRPDGGRGAPGIPRRGRRHARRRLSPRGPAERLPVGGTLVPEGPMVQGRLPDVAIHVSAAQVRCGARRPQLRQRLGQDRLGEVGRVAPGRPRGCGGLLA